MQQSDEQGRSMRISHFQYTSWHEKRVPECEDSILCFRNLVKSGISESDGPILVHCRWFFKYLCQWKLCYLPSEFVHLQYWFLDALLKMKILFDNLKEYDVSNIETKIETFLEKKNRKLSHHRIIVGLIL